MGWLIALAVLILLAMLPLGVSAAYHADGALVNLILGPARIKLFPRKKEDKKKEKPDKKTEEKEHKQKEDKPKDPGKNGGSVKDFLPLVRTALDFLGGFRRKLRVNRLEVKLILAADDPCDLAVNYGRAWAALGNLMPQLERLFVIKKRDLEVECDFTSNETRVIARLDLSITLGRLLGLLVRYGIRAVRQYFQIMNKRKGGANL